MSDVITTKKVVWVKPNSQAKKSSFVETFDFDENELVSIRLDKNSSTKIEFYKRVGFNINLKDKMSGKEMEESTNAIFEMVKNLVKKHNFVDNLATVYDFSTQDEISRKNVSIIELHIPFSKNVDKRLVGFIDEIRAAEMAETDKYSLKIHVSNTFRLVHDPTKTFNSDDVYFSGFAIESTLGKKDEEFTNNFCKIFLDEAIYQNIKDDVKKFNRENKIVKLQTFDSLNDESCVTDSWFAFRNSVRLISFYVDKIDEFGNYIVNRKVNNVFVNSSKSQDEESRALTHESIKLVTSYTKLTVDKLEDLFLNKSGEPIVQKKFVEEFVSVDKFFGNMTFSTEEDPAKETNSGEEAVENDTALNPQEQPSVVDEKQE